MISISLVTTLALAQVDYQREIKPLLRERCSSCHGALKQKGDLRVDTVAFLLEGGNTGPAIVAGKPNESLILERLSAAPDKRMPPKADGEAFTPAQLALIRRWIEEGAKGPSQEKAEEDPRRHWAFVPPVRPTPPAVKNAAWTKNPIDAFLAAEHEAKGVAPQPQASREMQLRRVYIDLIGLPPTRAERDAFLIDTSPDAYEKVVDSLLAKPQYGERWARHWMDVWRYSDWYGRRAVPDVWNSAPQIWRWRDWIVDSLNADKGYDRMVQEMLAGDEIAPGDPQAGVATGYLIRNWYALNPHQWMRDNVEHVGKAFLGLTFNCCHCHDHKYDPLLQEDYFTFRAFFEPIGIRQDRVRGEADPGPFQKYDLYTTRKIQKLGMVQIYDERPQAKTGMYAQGDERQKIAGKDALAPSLPRFFQALPLTVEPVKLPAHAIYPALEPWAVAEEQKQRDLAIADAIKACAKIGKDSTPQDTKQADLQLRIAVQKKAAFEARLDAEQVKQGLKPGEWDSFAKKASRLERLLTLTLAEETILKAEGNLDEFQKKLAEAKDDKERMVAQAQVKKREDLLTAAKAAYAKTQQTLAGENTTYAPLGPQYPATSTGRRKALALWITNRQNPLTARVAVNHLWLRHFDRGLVETVFDLGRNGKAPSHPGLLDWLAVELMDSGWKMKALHRLIVTSQAYRQASSGVSEIDPDNRLLWKFPSRRMEAEVVRDSLLYLAGQLDLTRGGEPIDNKEELASKRRSLYFNVYPEAGGHPAFLETFDAPDPCDCYQRGSSVIPQQALALTNHQLTVAQSRLLAGNLAKESDFVAAVFESILGRSPSAEERKVSTEFLDQQMKLFQDAGPLPKAAGVLVGAASDPRQRARESLVRVLFSHHDFVTIR